MLVIFDVIEESVLSITEIILEYLNLPPNLFNSFDPLYCITEFTMFDRKVSEFPVKLVL